MIESDGFGSNRTRHLTGFRDPTLLTIGHPNRLYKKNEMVLVMFQIPIIVLSGF